MLLSSLETTDAALFGAVVQGDVLDDGGPVESEALAMALELWRITGDLSLVVAGLEGWRWGEPWAEWIDAAIDGWRELAPRVEKMRVLAVAIALAGEASRAGHEERKALELQVERAAAARVVSERMAELTQAVLGSDAVREARWDACVKGDKAMRAEVKHWRAKGLDGAELERALAKAGWSARSIAIHVKGVLRG